MRKLAISQKLQQAFVFSIVGELGLIGAGLILALLFPHSSGMIVGVRLEIPFNMMALVGIL